MDLKKYKDKFSEYTYYLKDGKEVKHGLFKIYYENGKLKSEYNYKDGELEEYEHKKEGGWNGTENLYYFGNKF